MNLKELTEQLESLRDHSEEQIVINEHVPGKHVFNKDVEALDIVLGYMRELQDVNTESEEFKTGQLVAYCGKGFDNKIYKVEVGIFKRYTEDRKGAFVWYHSGSTAACTPVDMLYPLNNWFYFKNNIINSLDKGGSYDKD